jgi:hypothetical protein
MPHVGTEAILPTVGDGAVFDALDIELGKRVWALLNTRTVQ